jgi:hypothetical protein
LSEKQPELAYSAVAYSCSPASVTHTWVDGKLVYRQGSYTGGKQADIVNDALNQRRRLLGRL